MIVLSLILSSSASSKALLIKKNDQVDSESARFYCDINFVEDFSSTGFFALMTRTVNSVTVIFLSYGTISN